MLLSSEDSIRIELGILLSSGPSTCLNSNKLFLFSIIMMRKAAGAGKCAFEMIFFFFFFLQLHAMLSFDKDHIKINF